tara:strand:+ start:170 stop:553 length:384 start_codon:yes stop_codon:yes gene_type:complete
VADGVVFEVIRNLDVSLIIGGTLQGLCLCIGEVFAHTRLFSEIVQPVPPFGASAPFGGQSVEAHGLDDGVGYVAEASRLPLVVVTRGAHAGRWPTAVEAERTPAAVVVVAFHVTVIEKVLLVVVAAA